MAGIAGRGRCGRCELAAAPNVGKIAGFLYRRADRIVVVTSSFKEHLIEKWQVAPEKISVIENGVETELFNPAKSYPMLRRELSAEGKFIVGYIGTIGLAHGLETLLQAASELRETSPNVLFLIVGEGADKQRVMDIAAAQKLDNIRFVGQQPRNKIPEFILACDVCLVLLKSTDVFKTVIPTKMLEFMSCERPVIVGVDGEARRIVEEGEAGIFIRPENASDLVAAVHKLSADSALRESMGSRGRQYIFKRFSRQQTAREYDAVLQSVLKSQAAT